MLREQIALAAEALIFIFIIPLILISFSRFIDLELGLPSIPKPIFLTYISIILIALGLIYSGWATWTLYRVGRGTPSPAIPTRKLVTSGPYRHTRNPMILGMTSFYLGLGLFVGSITLMLFSLIVLSASSIYIKIVEERELESRFGEEYRRYREETPFLIPRLKKRKKKDAAGGI